MLSKKITKVVKVLLFVSTILFCSSCSMSAEKTEDRLLNICC